MAEDLQEILERIVGGSRHETDLNAMVSAIKSGNIKITQAIGKRSVSAGGSFTDSLIITGDLNFVFNGTDAKDLIIALQKISPDLLPLPPQSINDFLQEYRDKFAAHGEYVRWDLAPTGLSTPGARKQESINLDDMYVALRLDKNYSFDNSTKGRVITPEHLLKQNKPLAITGAAGTGKTTWIRWTFCQLLRDQNAFPILIELRHLAYVWENFKQQGQERSFEAYLKNIIAEHDMQDSDKIILTLLKNPPTSIKTIILIDGWDELGSLGEELRRKLLGFLKSYPKVLPVVTSRLYGEGRPTSSDGFEVLIFQPLSKDEIRSLTYRFLKYYCKLGEKEAEIDANQFMSELSIAANAYELAQTALMLTMMLLRVKKQSSRLIDKRHRLYYECLINMFSGLPKRKERDGALPFPEEYRPQKEDEVFNLTSYLAFRMYSQNLENKYLSQNNTILSTWDILLNILPEQWTEDERNGFLSWLANSAGLLVDRIDGKVSFVHRSFQEYLIGHYLYKSIDTFDEQLQLVKKMWSNGDNWEPLLLWAAILEDKKKQSFSLDNVLDKMLDDERYGIWLVGTILADGLGSNSLFHKWEVRLCEVLQFEWYKSVERCASAWKKSHYNRRRESIANAIHNMVNECSWIGFFRYQEWCEQAGFKLPPAPKNNLVTQYFSLRNGIVSLREQNIDERHWMAFGRVLSGAFPAAPFPTNVTHNLLVWPTHRRLSSYRLQNIASLTSDHEQLMATAKSVLSICAWNDEDKKFAKSCARDLSKLELVNKTAVSDLAIYYTRDWVRYLKRPWICDLILKMTRDWYKSRDQGGGHPTVYESWLSSLVFYELNNVGFDRVSVDGEWIRDLALQWGRTLGLEEADASLAVQFGFIEMMSLGRVHARDDFCNHYTVERIPLIREACKLSLSPRSNPTQFEEALQEYSSQELLWPALARYIARRALPTDLIRDKLRKLELCQGGIENMSNSY